MTAPITGHHGRSPLTDDGMRRLALWFSNGDLLLTSRAITDGQLWQRVAEGKRRD